MTSTSSAAATKIEENAGFTFADAAQVGGNLTVIKNTSSLEIEFNIVEGNVTIQDNIPSFCPSSATMSREHAGTQQQGPGFKQVVNNTIVKALQCFDNDPPFFGGPNVAEGKQGQCL